MGSGKNIYFEVGKHLNMCLRGFGLERGEIHEKDHKKASGAQRGIRGERFPVQEASVDNVLVDLFVALVKL